MEIKAWKLLVAILVCLLFLETAWIFIHIASAIIDDKNATECYDNICKEYPDAYYERGQRFCTCYDYNISGELVIAKNEYMGEKFK